MANVKTGGSLPEAAEISKLIYVNPATGEITESAASQTLQAYAFQTENYELSDSLLGKLLSPLQAFDSLGEVFDNSETGSIFTSNLSQDAQRGVKLVLSEETYISAVRINANRNTAPSHDFDVKLAIVADAEGVPGEEIASVVKGAMEFAENGAGVELIDFEFSGVTLPAGTYWIVLGYSRWVEAWIEYQFLTGAEENSGAWSTNNGIDWQISAVPLKASVYSVKANAFVATNDEGRLDESFLQYNIDFGGNVLSGVSSPIAGTDVANKDYVDSAIESAVPGVWYSPADAGAQASGQLVYLSAEDTVAVYDTLSNDSYVLGVSADYNAASGLVKVLANDTSFDADLSLVTKGGSPIAVNDRVFWDGSALTGDMPTTSGSRVWQVGVVSKTGVSGKVHVQVKLIKVNA